MLTQRVRDEQMIEESGNEKAHPGSFVETAEFPKNILNVRGVGRFADNSEMTELNKQIKELNAQFSNRKSIERFKTRKSSERDHVPQSRPVVSSKGIGLSSNPSSVGNLITQEQVQSRRMIKTRFVSDKFNNQ